MDKNKPDYVKDIEKLFGNAVEFPPEGVYIGEAVKYTNLRTVRRYISQSRTEEGKK